MQSAHFLPTLLLYWLALVAGLSGCSSLTSRPDYAPIDSAHPLGHAVMAEADGRYLVVFRGGRHLTQDQTEAYALQRAAELAVEAGKAGFEVEEKRCAPEMLIWTVPERRSALIQGTEFQTPSEQVLPGYTHELAVISCTLKVSLFDVP